jgi:hypothetical protein
MAAVEWLVCLRPRVYPFHGRPIVAGIGPPGPVQDRQLLW